MAFQGKGVNAVCFVPYRMYGLSGPKLDETKSRSVNMCSHRLYRLFGAFGKLRKATVSFVMHVRPSVRTKQLDFHWMDFYEIWHSSFFRKSIDKIKF